MKIKNVALINSISSVFLQIITVISGFILPKIILSYFGSEVNGLVSSLGQFLGYINLLEGGVLGVVMANLYKPLYNKDYKKLSSVVKTSDKFLKKISKIFIVYSIILAIFYPIIFKTSFSYIYIFSLVIILSINLFMQYCFSLNLRTLLNADKKVYIISLVQAGCIIVNVFLAIISVKIYPNIHFLKIITSVCYIIVPLIYRYFVNKYYKIDKNASIDSDLLKSRWDGLAINIAYFIHSNTDVTILTFFTDLKMVSVYGVYKAVVSGINQLIIAISSAISPSIGHIYASENKDELNKKFDIYEFVIFFLVFFLFTVAGLLIVPFIMIYTNGIDDANYYQPIFAIFLILSEAIYLLKSPHVNLAYSANKFKQMTIPAYIEAALNIIFSIFLVGKFGLIGVAIGTFIAMTYRTIYQVIFLKKNILNRSVWIFFKKLIIFFITGTIGILICVFLIPKVQYTISSWILHGIIYTFIIMILYGVASYIFYKEEIKYLLKFIKRS